MALSNWTTWSALFSPKSNNILFNKPTFRHNNVALEIYKNELHMKVFSSNFLEMEPETIVLREGRLSFRGLEIIAERGPQQGIYVHCSRYHVPGDKALGVIMCGVFGYEEGEWAGVEKTSLSFFYRLLQKWKEERLISFPKQLIYELIGHSSSYGRNKT